MGRTHSCLRLLLGTALVAGAVSLSACGRSDPKVQAQLDQAEAAAKRAEAAAMKASESARRAADYASRAAAPNDEPSPPPVSAGRDTSVETINTPSPAAT